MDSSIVNLLSAYQLPAIFFGSFFFGESVILTAAFLAGQGIWSVSSVFWLALAGTIISDSLWFLFGQTFLKFTKRWGKYQNKYQPFLAKIEMIAGKKPFLSLLFIKFLYGTRILTILYLSIRRIEYHIFFIFNTIGTVLWLLVMITIGWLAGKGITNMVVFYRAEFSITVLVLLIVLFRVITIWLRKKIIKK